MFQDYIVFVTGVLDGVLNASQIDEDFELDIFFPGH